MSAVEKMMKPSDAAALLGVTNAQFYEWMKKWKDGVETGPRCIRIGERYFFTESTLREWQVTAGSVLNAEVNENGVTVSIPPRKNVLHAPVFSWVRRNRSVYRRNGRKESA